MEVCGEVIPVEEVYLELTLVEEVYLELTLVEELHSELVLVLASVVEVPLGLEAFPPQMVLPFHRHCYHLRITCAGVHQTWNRC